MLNNSIAEEIKKIKAKRNAVILAHNYQIPEVQDIADFVGDSLDLSRKAAETNADIIVFCGVHFMAETAAILSPQKKVILPDLNAGCPMANMITAKQLKEFKKKYPASKVVCYINTSASVKAESDICCTSANASQILKSIDKSDKIIFVPDKYLGSYASKISKREVILWNGYCPTHMMITAEEIKEAKNHHPSAEVLVHPECNQEVIALADKVFSTTGICNWPGKSKAKEFIIGTETGIIHRLKKMHPDKKFYPAASRAVCPNMKLINLEKVLWSLEDLKYEIKVPEKIRKKAYNAVRKMLRCKDRND